VTSAGRTSTGVGLLATLALLAGCGGSASGGNGDAPPKVTVRAGGDPVDATPTQYCLDGDGQRYQSKPPYLEVAPDTTIELSVPEAVAAAGWSVQVFDEKLEEKIGDVEVPAGQATFTEISTSDVVPPTFYLVVVEDSDPDACSGLAGAWPVGFIRTDA
jgi:Protein of unknown function (DUF2771)